MRGGTGPLARAYATLGIDAGTSAADVARQYKRLAKRWHPDRYQSDPQGRVEAAQRMREINRAYTVVREALAATDRRVVAAAPAPVSSVRDFGYHLTEEQIQDLARATDATGVFATLAAYAFRGGCLVGGFTEIGIGDRYQRPLDLAFGVLLLALAAGSIVKGMWRDR